jgi:tetratricopeptide (TPR) repeat protein/serine/threonine protein kinase
VTERDLFIAALQIEDPAGRAAYLDQACGADVELRRRAEALLTAFARAGSFLQQPAADTPATSDVPPDGPTLSAAPAAGPGTVLGPYRLIQPIGEGGMGTVFLAEQTRPVQREVALKVIKPGMDSRQVIARFEAERQALALMDHPHIARVLDAGTTDTGLPYFVMELVKGVPITAFCDERRLTLRQRLELFLPVCQAVQHAHQKGVIHRDLKPSNVLVAQYDDKPVPKVIDFGVAKAAGARLTEQTLCTGLGQVVGTLEYMSPEQAELNQLDVDTRSDIYSLGVLLYELLTGTTPLERARFKDAGMLEVLRLIREEESPTPSTRLSTAEALPRIAADRGVEPRKLSGLVRGELDWIVMKCLEKDRERRYESASALALDVRRYLADEPVLARRPSAGYRLRKFARRHKGRLVVGGLVLVCLVALAGLVVDQAARERTLHEKVNRALEETEGLYRDRKPGEALAAVRQAELLLPPGGRPQLRERVRRWRTDLEMVRRLEETSLRGGFEDDNPFKLSAEYRAAFRDYGLDLEALSPEEAAERVRASAIKAELIAGLDAWAFNPRRKGRPSTEELLAVVRLADPDDWRDKLRRAVLNKEDRRLGSLAGDRALKSQPRHTLVLLRHALFRAGQHARALEISRHAQGLFPRNFVTTCVLAQDLQHEAERAGLGAEKKPELALEAAGLYRVACEMRPDSPTAWHNLAVALAWAGRHKEAIPYFRRALERRPDSPLTCSALGGSLWDSGQRREGLAMLRAAIKLDPQEARSHFNLGLSLEQKGDLEGAIAAYTAATKLSPGYYQAHHRLGLALRDAGRMKEALASFHTAVKLEPKSAVALYNFGVVLRESGQADQALKCFRAAVKVAPRYVEAHHNLGDALMARGQVDEAIACYRTALDLDPRFVACHNNLGSALRRKGRFAEAIAALRTAVRLDPKNAHPHNNLGGALAEAGQTDAAIDSFRKATALAPKSGKAHNSLGLAWVQRGRPDKAIAPLKEATRLAPMEARYHYNLGHAYHETGQLDDAVRAYCKAVEIDPSLAEAHNALGVNLLEQGGRVEEAIVSLQAAIKANPKLAAAHNNLGSALNRNRRLDDAIRAYRKAIAIDPRYAQAHHNLGLALLLQKKQQEALGCFERAVSLRPAYPATHYQLAAIYSRQARWEKALHHWDEVVKQSGLHPAVRPQRATVRAALGRWAEASADLASLLDRPPSGESLRLAGSLLLLIDDTAGHQQLCRRLARVLEETKEPRLAALVSRFWTLDVAPAVEPARSVHWAEEAVAADKTATALHVLGRAQYRAGKFKEALAACEASLKADPKWPGAPLNWLVLALAHQRLGQPREARAWFARAEELTARAAAAGKGPVCPPGTPVLDWLEIQLLYREARTTLAAPPRDKP